MKKIILLVLLSFMLSGCYISSGFGNPCNRFCCQQNCYEYCGTIYCY